MRAENGKLPRLTSGSSSRSNQTSLLVRGARRCWHSGDLEEADKTSVKKATTCVRLISLTWQHDESEQLVFHWSAESNTYVIVGGVHSDSREFGSVDSAPSFWRRQHYRDCSLGKD